MFFCFYRNNLASTNDFIFGLNGYCYSGTVRAEYYPTAKLLASNYLRVITLHLSPLARLAHKASTLQFKLARSQLVRFEDVANKHLPHDPRVLTEANPDPPARNCSNWIDDVSAEAKTLA